MPNIIEFLGYNPQPQPITLGDQIAYARISRGWSRKRLAQAAGVDEATVRRMEENRKGLARRSLLKVRRVLTVQADPG